jgi:hypothetical protein
MWGANGDGARRGLVTIVEFQIDPRPSICQPPVYGRLIYTVKHMSDRLLSQANTNPHFLPHQDCVAPVTGRVDFLEHFAPLLVH